MGRGAPQVSPLEFTAAILMRNRVGATRRKCSVQLLGSMKSVEGRVLVKGFYDGVTPLNTIEKQAIAEAPVVDAITSAHRASSSSIRSRMLRRGRHTHASRW